MLEWEGGEEVNGKVLKKCLVQPQHISRLFQRTGREERGGRAGEEVGGNLVS